MSDRLRVPHLCDGCRATLLITAISLAVLPLRGQSVRSEAGRILVRDAQGHESPITATGRDTLPVLSPQGDLVAFIRRVPGDSVATAYGQAERTTLWVIRLDGTGARELSSGAAAATPERSLAGLTMPAFAPDGQMVYVASAGWVTSGALHAVTVATGHVRFVCAANGYEVLTRGKYRGYLLVNQHRYRASGSYDGTWLVALSGRRVRLIALEDAPDASARLAAARAGRLE